MSATSEDKPQLCPFCQSTKTEMVSLFGQTLLGSQYKCKECHSFFEAVRFNEQQLTSNSQQSTENNQ